MSEQHLQSQLDRVYRQVRMMLAPAIAVATDDKGPLLKIQTKIHGTPEIIDGLGLMQFYGFHANPLPGTDVMAMFVGGDRSNGILIASNHQDHRPRNYKPGEIGIYTDEGDTVTLNRDNQLNINSKKQVTVKGKDKVKLDTPLTEIAKDVKAFGKIDASEGFFKNGVAMGGAGAPGPAGPAGPAGPQGPAGPAGSYQAGSGIAINTGTTPPTISTAVPYLPISGGTINGPLTIANDQGIGYGGQWAMYNAAAGATNPAKYFRLSPVGTLEIINNAYSAVEFQFADNGAFALTTGPIYMANTTFASQDATYHRLYDKSGRASIYLGGTADSENYYDNTTHRFRGVAGATYDYYIDSGGITLQNASAFRGRKTDGSLVNLAYLDQSNNVIIGGYGSGLPCFVGSGGSYFWTEGTLYAGAHIILKNGLSLQAKNASGNAVNLLYLDTNDTAILPYGVYIDGGGQIWSNGAVIIPNAYYYFAKDSVGAAQPILGMGADNRINLNPSGYGVTAGGAWTFGGLYLYLAGGTGSVNAAGGPFLYTDTNWIIFHLGPGNAGFQVQSSAGRQVGGIDSSGWLTSLDNRRVAVNDGTYTQFQDGSARPNLFLGGTADQSNYYRNVAHQFQGVAGGGYTFIIDGGGITLTNNVAYRSRDASGGLVNLIYIGSDNYVRIGQNGANFITPDGTFYHSGNVVIPNGTYYYCKINDGNTPYNILGVGTDNRVKINPAGLGVDASGGWTFGSGLIVNAPITSSGSTAFLQFADRTVGYNWAWYGIGGLVRLWNSSSGDIGPFFDTAGNVFVRNSQGYFGYDNTGNTRQLAAIDSANNSLFASGAQAHTYVYTLPGGYSIYFPNSYLIVSNWNAFKPGGGVWADVSERQYKEDIADYTAGLDVITRLRPREFKFNGEGMSARDGRTHRGLIYDEVEDIMPEMTGVYRHRDSAGNVEREFKTLDATSLIYALVNAVKELAGEVDALRARA